MNKLNLITDERVRLVKLGPWFVDTRRNLNGALGTVLGVASRHIVDCYIIKLDEPYTIDGFTHRAVAMVESCLERI